MQALALRVDGKVKQHLCAGISKWIRYQSREDEGTQSPQQTLDRG
jgi:hypothetical protein